MFYHRYWVLFIYEYRKLQHIFLCALSQRPWGEKARWELHKNATSYTEKILEATSQKNGRCTISYLWSQKPSKEDGQDMQGSAGKVKNELISDVLPRTPSHGYASVGRPTITYIQQFCTDTGCVRSNGR